jgi:Kdo2-lipid IVA lauroyltransferase/acyltransferase
MTPETRRFALYHPRFWTTWVGIAMLRMISVLPLPMLSAIGSGLGILTYRLFGSRRRIAATNIRMVFPELTEAERTQLTREHFKQMGRSVASMGMNWFASTRRLERLFQIEGREHLDRLVQQGSNVILLAPHFVALEIGGIFISRIYPTIGMYQFIKNPAMDRMVRNGRSRFGGELVERKASMHQLIRRIRSGKLFYYLPDQDAGRKRGIFVPFFGIETATYPMLSQFARLSRAKVVTCLTQQLDGGRGWKVILLPPLDPFPTDDEARDTEYMNRTIEEAIRLMPSQYFWLHKRFKTRPEGEESFY